MTALGLRPQRARRAACRDDEGQIMLLVIGYTVVALMLVLVVVSASAVHLQRKQLFALADAAALAAADDVDQTAYYRTRVAPGEGVPLTDRSVRESAAGYLAGADPGRLKVGVDAATGTDQLGRQARVRLCATLYPPFTGWVLATWADGIPACATAVADVDLTRA